MDVVYLQVAKYNTISYSNLFIKCVTKTKTKIFYSVLICIQQDAILHSLFYLEPALHVSGGTSTHHQERQQLYL